MKASSRVPWLYEWVDEGVMPRRLHARAYASFMTYRMLMVLWPFHYVVIAVMWFDYKWNAYRTSATIIDKEIRRAMESDLQHRFNRTYIETAAPMIIRAELEKYIRQQQRPGGILADK
jgi:hypothetical protein